MPRDFPPIQLEKVRTYSISERSSKVSTDDFADPWQQGGSLSRFFDGLPDILGAADLKAVIAAIARAYGRGKTVAIGMGAHVIKVGLNPVIIDLMERGVIHALALNGAGIIHDFELAFSGQTSEDVAAAIGDGSFGMARETCGFLGEAILRAKSESVGLGTAVGRSILDHELPFAGQSILAAGERLGVPVTVHVAIGTDIIHMHPEFDAAAAGEASHRDFRSFTSVVASLSDGVYLNIGSAVILPEIFLKAITLARNLGYAVERLTTVNMDFIRHYRPMTNVVHRPTLGDGHGYNLVGHHEIMIPLLAAGVIEALDSDS